MRTDDGGFVHDIGKILVPADILSKPGKLTKPEFEMLKDHTRIGYEILKTIEFPWPIAKIVLQHHERMNARISFRSHRRPDCSRSQNSGRGGRGRSHVLTQAFPSGPRHRSGPGRNQH
jgi:hypothetical protein